MLERHGLALRHACTELTLANDDGIGSDQLSDLRRRIRQLHCQIVELREKISTLEAWLE
ncbi:MAG: hypothetical protein OEZ39_08140 [Gammaproteobacteria bacterium]|nr:hypothetical protein [Gammaproteobacteria bacterium]